MVDVLNPHLPPERKRGPAADALFYFVRCYYTAIRTKWKGNMELSEGRGEQMK